MNGVHALVFYLTAIFVVQGCLEKEPCDQYFDLTEQGIDTNRLNRNLYCINNSDTLLLLADFFYFKSIDSSRSSINDHTDCSVGVNYGYYLITDDSSRLNIYFSFIGERGNFTPKLTTSEDSYLYSCMVDTFEFKFSASIMVVFQMSPEQILKS